MGHNQPQVDNQARFKNEGVGDIVVNQPEVKVDSDPLASSLVKVHRKAVKQSPMKVKKRKVNVNLAPIFKGFNPPILAETLARRNERKLTNTGDDSESKSVTTKRTAKQSYKGYTIIDSQIWKIVIVEHPSLLYVGCKKAELLKKLEGDCPWTWDEIISVSSTSSTAATSATSSRELTRSSSADEHDDSVKEEEVDNTAEDREIIPEEA